MAQELLIVALKTGLLISAAAIASLLLARSSAATRHLVWISALALALLLPLASAAMPGYAVMQDPWAAAPQAAAAATDHGDAPLTVDLLLALWGAGALVFLLRDLLGHAGLSRFFRRARPLRSPHWSASLEALDERPAMRVLESDRVAGPCTWGFLMPVLVLPEQAERWSEAERRYALTHELAHIARRDYISASVARLACAVHWYNPLVWYAARQAHRLQEQACDDAVLRSGAVASDYAQLLVGIAQSCGCSPRAAMAMTERSPLYRRVSAILDPAKARGRQSRAGALAIVLPLACVMALIAGAGLAEPEAARAAEPAAAPRLAEAVAEATPATQAAPAQTVRRHRRQAALPTPLSPPTASTAPQALAALRPVPPVPALRPVPPVQRLPAFKPGEPLPPITPPPSD